MISWTIGQNNVDIALASISHNSDVENEIRNSVRAGKVATIHDSPLAYAGGTFVGYTIIDPVTGAGAYKIGGGENGGILFALGVALGALISLILMSFLDLGGPGALLKSAGRIPLGFIMGYIAAAAAFITIFAGVMIALSGDRKGAFGVFFAGITTGLAIAGLGALVLPGVGAVGGGVAGVISTILGITLGNLMLFL